MPELSAEQKVLAKMFWAVDREAAAQAEPDSLPVIRTGKDLDAFLLDYFGIRLPNVRVCPNHSTPHRAFHAAYFAESPIAVWKASRGMGGKSFTLSLLGLAEALTLRADVNVLGGSGEQSQRILESMGKLWAVPQAPRQFLRTDPGSRKTVLTWGNAIKALMASQTSVRGPHPQRLRLDEVDEMKLGILDSALGQPMSRGDVQSQTVISSTHQYPDGTMSEVLKRATARGWPVFEWCYHETKEPHGWLSLKEIERLRSVITDLMWRTEYELQEPTGENRAIDQDAVAAMFRQDLVFEETPDPTFDYAHGADWARKTNRTVIVTLRKPADVDDSQDLEPEVVQKPKEPLKVAALTVAEKEPWPTMVGHLETHVRTFGGPAVHDGTGVGDVVAGYLNVEAEAFIMVGKARADLLTEYVHAIEHAEIVCPDDGSRGSQIAKKEHKFATFDDLYGAGHLPDTIAAGALAYRAAKTAQGGSGTLSDPKPADRSVLQAGFRRSHGIFQRRGR
jgi:hypothetical protein